MRVSRQKITYQRNMLIGQGVALTLSLIFAILLQYALPGSKDTVRLNLSSIPLVDLFRSNPNRTGNSTAGGGSNGGGRTYQFGPNPAIVDDSVEVTRIWTADFPSYGDLESSYDGFGNGPQYGWGGDDVGDYETGEYVSQFEPSVELLNRSVGIISARKPDYPLIALERRLEGEVELLLLVDSLGQVARFPFQRNDRPTEIVDHLLLKEEPTSWFFAQNSLTALKDWRFYPAVEHGRVVSSFLKVHIRFALGEDSAWLMLETPNNP